MCGRRRGDWTGHPAAGAWHMLAYVPEADGWQAAVIWVGPASGVSARPPAPLPGACVYGGGPAPEICGNGFDDDGDGLADCADPDCSGATECQPQPPPAPPPPPHGGGCSSAGSGGALALLVLAAGLVRRRRWRDDRDDNPAPRPSRAAR